MGWSGPGRQRHRAACTRVRHACGGEISLPGWLEGARAFVRSARLRDGFVRFSGRGGPCGWGRRPGRDARDPCGERRGQRHGAMPYASIADDSEVVRNRPIKCCDGFHSIPHYHRAAATGGKEARHVGVAIREILTGPAMHTCSGTLDACRQEAAAMRVVAIRPVIRISEQRIAHGSKPHPVDHVPPSGRTEPGQRTSNGERA